MNMLLKSKIMKNLLTFFKKEHFFSNLKNGYPDDEELQRTMDLIKKLNIKIGEGLTEMFLKSSVLLLACVFEKLIKVSVKEYGNNPVHCFLS